MRGAIDRERSEAVGNAATRPITAFSWLFITVRFGVFIEANSHA